MNRIFRDRVEAGQFLAKRLPAYARRDDVIILALPRGGVPIGFEVACELLVPLDILLVRKLGVPGREEVAMGAIACGGVQVLDHSVIRAYQVRPTEIDAAACRELRELQRRSAMYRGERPLPKLEDMIVVLVDDGILTGATMRVAIQVISQAKPRTVIVAAPVAASEAVSQLWNLADNVVSVLTPTELESIAPCYGDFAPTSDDEVIALLKNPNDRCAIRSFQMRRKLAV